MLPINDLLDQILLGSFFFGLLFAAASIFLGSVDLGGHGGDAGADAGHHGFGSFFNFSTILAFIAWFGGVGYVARNGLGWVAPLAVVVGLAGGLAGAYVVSLFLRKVLAAGDTSMDPRDYELPGTLARVTSSIRSGGTGEVVYEQAGYRQVSAARAIDGSPLARGTEVVILETRAGVAYVQPWEALIADHDEAMYRTVHDQEFQALDAVEPPEPDDGRSPARSTSAHGDGLPVT